jgi:hypothetical protein
MIGKKIGYYILDENKNIIKSSYEQWSEFIADFTSRVVKQTDIDEDTRVSTVFLIGILSTSEVFETMVFGDDDELEVQHYKTWDEALKGHDEMVLKYMK